MDYLYYLANASLCLRVIQRLNGGDLPVRFATVIHQIDGWAIRVKMSRPLAPNQKGNFKAFMDEIGFLLQPNIRLQMALWSLETGQSPVEVMRRYQVAVVSHGVPEGDEIEAFRSQFVSGLGYCPETLA